MHRRTPPAPPLPPITARNVLTGTGVTFPRLLPYPASIHIRLQQRAGPVLTVPQPVVEHLHDGQASVQP
jgi:hypothetical protein